MANKAASDLGQLALRRPLSAQDRSPGCRRLRPAAAKQPVGRRWHPGHICGAWYRRRQRTGSGSASPSCASAAPRRRCPPSPSPSPSPASASCAGARGCRRCPRSGCASPCCHEPPRRRARVREGRFDRGGTADPLAKFFNNKKTCGLRAARCSVRLADYLRNCKFMSLDKTLSAYASERTASTHHVQWRRGASELGRRRLDAQHWRAFAQKLKGSDESVCARVCGWRFGQFGPERRHAFAQRLEGADGQCFALGGESRRDVETGRLAQAGDYVI